MGACCGPFTCLFSAGGLNHSQALDYKSWEAPKEAERVPRRDPPHGIGKGGVVHTKPPPPTQPRGTILTIGTHPPVDPRDDPWPSTPSTA